MRDAPVDRVSAGVAATLSAFLMWGLLPPYWKAVAQVAPVEVLAHRVLWSAAFLLAILIFQGRLGALWAALRGRRSGPLQILNAGLLATNWFLFIWGVQTGRVVECSLGYFMNPLANIAIGACLLRERLRRMQYVAIVLAVIGVAHLTIRQGVVPWLGLGLVGSFSLYGLVRKVQSVEALPGVAAETTLLGIPAMVLLTVLSCRTGRQFWLYDGAAPFLLPGAGVVTGLPLLLFGYGIRHIRMSTVGFLQYTAPTCMFLLGLFVYKEPFSSIHAISFGFIWTGLAIYVVDTAHHIHRRGQPGRGHIGIADP